MSSKLKKPVVGTLPEYNAQRDAIHVPIAPVIAGERLSPGQKVKLNASDLAVSSSVGFIGVVDPYLAEDVLYGQTFWLLLIPETLSSLRHEWSHPAFKEKSVGSLYDEYDECAGCWDEEDES